MRWEGSHLKVIEAVYWHWPVPVLLALVLTPLRRQFFFFFLNTLKTKSINPATENKLPSRKGQIAGE